LLKQSLEFEPLITITKPIYVAGFAKAQTVDLFSGQQPPLMIPSKKDKTCPSPGAKADTVLMHLKGPCKN